MITIQKMINSLGSYVDHSLLQLFHLVRSGDISAMTASSRRQYVGNGDRITRRSERVFDDDCISSSVDNFSAQGAGILFAASMSITQQAQATFVESTSSSSSSSGGPDNDLFGTVSTRHHTWRYGDITAVTSWISQSVLNFTDSSMFYAVDYLVVLLQEMQNKRNLVGTVWMSLQSSCELAFLSIVKNCQFLKRYKQSFH